MLVAAPDPIHQGFQNPPNDARLRMYWRIFGPAMERSEIDYQLDVVKKAGLGGLVAYFMYPFALDDPAEGIVNQRFGSPEFLETFGYAARRAKQLGLRLGINGGTGWPYGGPSVSVEDSAKKLVEVIVTPGGQLPVLGPLDRLIGAFADGKLIKLSRPPSGKELHLFVEKPTMRQVKRSALGGEGLEVDPWNTAALERWLAANVDPMLKATDRTLDTLGCDSLEVYDANWAADLPDEFKRRCSYDLIPNLDAAYHDTTAKGNAVRFDYWRTLTELFEERFTIPLGAYCDKNKISLEMEAYGTPPSPMTSARAIQVPTGEHYEWRGFAVQKYVASAANMAGRNIIGSEAWTWAGLPKEIQKITGKYPAVWGGEWGFSDERHDTDNVKYRPRLLDQIREQHRAGRIVVLTYHQASPTVGEPCDFKGGVQIEITEADWEAILTEGTPLNRVWSTEVDRLATALQTLQAEHIPVIFRPYHEMNGEWFWWGGQPGRFKALWSMIYDRFVNRFNLDNLLWAWNCDKPHEGVEAYFPGHNAVDLVGADIYPVAGANEVYPQEWYDRMLKLAAGKPLALSEMSKVPSPVLLEKQHYTWFMGWDNMMVRANTPEQLKKTFGHPKVISDRTHQP